MNLHNIQYGQSQHSRQLHAVYDSNIYLRVTVISAHHQRHFSGTDESSRQISIGWLVGKTAKYIYWIIHCNINVQDILVIFILAISVAIKIAE